MSKRFTAAILASLLVAFAPAALAQAPQSAAPVDDKQGVKVGSASFVRKLVPAETLENAALQQYGALKKQAGEKGALLPPDDPHNVRLRRIARDLLPHAHKWNPRAKDWKWEVVVIKSGNINAFCMPGGKIAFFTGILDQLKLTDAEVAAVMGHEIAHALREHARERAAKNMLTKAGAVVVSVLVGGNAGELSRVGGGLLGLKFSRDDEKEADLIGLELAARAGYDPRAGITLWEKMSAAAKGAPPQWLSTHPSGQARIDLIKKHLPEVMPLYERSPKRG